MSNWYVSPSVREQHVITNLAITVDGRSREITLDERTLPYLSSLPDFKSVEQFLRDSLFMAIAIKEHKH